MAISTIKTTLPYNIEKIWEIITSNTHYSWRSDISRIEIISDYSFTEITKDGITTLFTITCFEPYHRYEFDMENDNMKGHWSGFLQECGRQTTLEFTEDVTAKKVFMKPLVGIYLKKQQKTYLHDLEKELKRS